MERPLTIPHNSNGSDGWMFQTTNWAGEPIDAAYAELRMRNEPLVENTQVKGTSDTHPLLSPNDEWADFEIMPLRIASQLLSQAPGSYTRDAYLRGLLMEETDGINPYKFGVIGSSDTHNAAGSFEEDNYWSKTGVLDIDPFRRGSVPLPTSSSSHRATCSPQFTSSPSTTSAAGSTITSTSPARSMTRTKFLAASSPMRALARIPATRPSATTGSPN